MRIRYLWFIVITLLAQNSCISSQERAKNEIQAALDQCTLAVSTKNIELYMEGIPKDFIIRDENGELITREMQRNYALRDWSIIDTTLSNIYVLDSLELYMDSAIAFTSQKWKRMMFRKDGITTDTVLTTQLHKEIWKQRQGKWLCYEVEELGGKIFINGEEYFK